MSAAKKGTMIALGAMPVTDALPGPRLVDERPYVGAVHLAREEVMHLREDLEKLYVHGMCSNTPETITSAYGQAVMTLSSISEYLERIEKGER